MSVLTALLIMVAVWIICFLSFCGLTNWPVGMDSTRFLKVTVFTVSGVCLTLGICAAANFIEFDKKFRLLIWTALVASIFAAVGVWLKATTL
jgi:hypothetical protein